MNLLFTTANAGEELTLTFTTANLFDSLLLMLLGMVGIFVVMLIIMAAVKLMNIFTKD